ncbi:uncharacterized protein LOC100376368, partial [Saccoglossus kowalevskii]|uniref:Uncharacterized protein LOC100376368 n=1 Tax=Saccoglossus kowalevskii TaxID=10224 RepID=A0ABM0GQX1_SACKO
ECSSDPCGTLGPCYNRVLPWNSTLPQYVCECPQTAMNTLTFMGFTCDVWTDANSKLTCFGESCMTGTFTSPNYPDLYLPRHRSLYLIYAPNAASITFVFDQNFEVETSKDEMYAGEGLQHPFPLVFQNKTTYPIYYVYEGYVAPPPLTLPGDTVWMLFDTDKTRQYRGWSLNWTASLQQEFNVEPVNVTVTEGENVTFESSVLYKHGVMSWIRDGSFYINRDLNMQTTDTRYSIVSTIANTMYNLHILNTEVNDAGTFVGYVSAKYAHQAIYTNLVNLVVHANQAFVDVPSTLTINEGEDVDWRVSVSDKHGTLSWYRDDTKLTHDDSLLVSDTRISVTSITINTDYTLHINGAVLSDAGTYIVRVTGGDLNDIPIETNPVTLNVHDLAMQSFVVVPSTTETVEGLAIVLKCQVDHKEGTLIWSKDGVDITSDVTITSSAYSSRYSITGDQSQGEYFLTISETENGDNGIYSVRVTAPINENSLEIKSQDATLIIHDHQRFITTPDNITIVEGQPLVLQVSVSNKHGIVTWVRNHVDISSDYSMTVNDARMSIQGTTQDVNFDLHINNVIMSDAGSYTVRVSAGALEDTNLFDYEITTVPIYITVQDIETQSFTKEPESADVAESGTLVFYCEVDHKEGTLIWSKDGIDISSDTVITGVDSRYSIVGDHSNGEYHLQITDIKYADIGQYTVRVSAGDNSQEITSSTVSLTVRAPTAPQEPKCSVSRINNNQTLQLKCESSGGDPPAILYWSGADNIVHGVHNQSSSVNVMMAEIVITHSLEGAVLTCMSNHVTFTESKTCSVGPIQTGLSLPPSMPLCSISNDNLILSDTALLSCESMGGNPPATLTWSKDNVVYNGEWLSTETEVRIGLEINLTRDMDGAIFTCAADHSAFNETKTCTVGPLNIVEIPWWLSVWFWLLLALLLLALIIILILCCCCCCRGMLPCGFCNYSDRCLACCPCLRYCVAPMKKSEKSEASTMIEADDAVLIGFSRGKQTSDLSTQTPGYLAEDGRYIKQVSQLEQFLKVTQEKETTNNSTHRDYKKTKKTTSKKDESSLSSSDSDVKEKKKKSGKHVMRGKGKTKGTRKTTVKVIQTQTTDIVDGDIQTKDDIKIDDTHDERRHSVTIINSDQNTRTQLVPGEMGEQHDYCTSCSPSESDDGILGTQYMPRPSSYKKHIITSNVVRTSTEKSEGTDQIGIRLIIYSIICEYKKKRIV